MSGLKFPVRAASFQYQMPFYTGQYILACQALELALKAYLAGKGLPDKKLEQRPLRHNLVNLYQLARDRGLVSLQRQQEGAIEWVNHYHDGAELRYNFTQTRTLARMLRVVSDYRNDLSCK